MTLSLSAGVAFACTAVEVPHVKRHADLIFLGTVAAQTFKDGNETVTFRVTRVWKGHAPEVLEIQVNPMSGACIHPFLGSILPGTEFMIFATKRKDAPEYTLSTYPPQHAEDYRQELGPGRKPQAK